MSLKGGRITQQDIAAWNPPPLHVEPKEENETLAKRMDRLESAMSQIAYRFNYAGQCYEQLSKRVTKLELELKALQNQSLTFGEAQTILDFIKEITP